MATSGSTSFTLLLQDLTEEAFALLGMSIEGESVSSEMYVEAKRTLNILMAKLQDQGIHLWSYQEGVLFLEGGKYKYIPEQSKACNEYYQTYLTVDAISPTTSLTVNTALSSYNVATETDPVASWNVGIVKNDNEIFWSTVSSYNPATGALELNDALDGDADENCTVFFYENDIQRIDRVLEARRTDSFVNDNPLNFVSRDVYFRLPLKTSEGIPAEMYYSRQRDYGELYLWPVPQDGKTLIRFIYERKLEDFVDANDSPDIPKYWLEALTAECAVRLGLKYGVNAQRMQMIRTFATEAMNEALSYDNEVYDIEMNVNRRG